jgi:hypothetical protein
VLATRPWEDSADAVVRALGTDAARGLTAGEAARQLADGAPTSSSRPLVPVPARSSFGIEALSALQLAVVLVASCTPFVAVEIEKAVRRRQR